MRPGNEKQGRGDQQNEARGGGKMNPKRFVYRRMYIVLHCYIQV